VLTHLTVGPGVIGGGLRGTVSLFGRFSVVAFNRRETRSKCAYWWG